MSFHPTEFQGSVVDALREAIERQIPDSRAEVNSGGGHFNIEVTSPAFAGKNMLESQRMVVHVHRVRAENPSAAVAQSTECQSGLGGPVQAKV